MSSELEPVGVGHSRPECSVCNRQVAIYTCPGCLSRTCSAGCSKTHKTNTSCSGERNKVAYVPMNQYGWGSMMDDYSFLEDMGRKVGGWGSEIVKGGYSGQSQSNRGQKPDRGFGKVRGRGKGIGGKTKRDLLRLQLEVRDIDMDVLPAGMERRKLNQSVWDFKRQTAFFTIEFIFHRPTSLDSMTHEPNVYSILSHRNDINQTLVALLRKNVREKIKSGKNNSSCPSWVSSMILLDDEEVESDSLPQCVMTAPLDPRSLPPSTSIPSLPSIRPQRKLGYYRLGIKQPLQAVLRRTHFVEFPTIEIWEEFHGYVVNAEGKVTEIAEEEMRRPVKRRKLDQAESKKAMKGLLGGYGSESEDSDEPDESTANGLTQLDYGSGSEAEEGPSPVDDLDIGSDTEEAQEEDPARLMELLKDVHGEELWASKIADALKEDEKGWVSSEGE